GELLLADAGGSRRGVLLTSLAARARSAGAGRYSRPAGCRAVAKLLTSLGSADCASLRALAPRALAGSSRRSICPGGDGGGTARRSASQWTTVASSAGSSSTPT